MEDFDRETLASYDGSNGKPVYVAYQGKVYDVTRSKLWAGGAHMKRHVAGADLTGDIEDAPHDPDVLKRFRQVGMLRE
jgi:predicted heme/steroid binding protein